MTLCELYAKKTAQRINVKKNTLGILFVSAAVVGKNIHAPLAAALNGGQIQKSLEVVQENDFLFHL